VVCFVILVGHGAACKVEIQNRDPALDLRLLLLSVSHHIEGCGSRQKHRKWSVGADLEESNVSAY
jgi:hypothetical protein